MLSSCVAAGERHLARVHGGATGDEAGDRDRFLRELRVELLTKLLAEPLAERLAERLAELPAKSSRPMWNAAVTRDEAERAS